MKKILPIFAVCILVLSGLGIAAVPNEKQIINKPLNTQDWGVEIVVEGWWFGYRVSVGTVTNESVTGDYIINITTNASRMLVGKELGYDLMNFTSDEPGFPIIPHLKPLIGFGSAIINISVSVSITAPVVQEFLFEEEVKGFVLLFYVLCSKTTFHIP